MYQPVTNVTYIADGASVEYAVPFPYILRSFVKVYINSYPTTNFTWLSNTRIKLALPPDADSKVLLQRETQLEPLVTFHDATVLTASDLNLATLQAIHLLQEGHDHVATLESLGITNNENFVLPPLDAGTVLGVLQGRIGALELETGLNGRIDLIDADTTGLVDRMVAAEGNINTLTTQLGQLSADPWASTTTYGIGTLVEYQGKLYKSLQVDNLNNLPDEVSSAWWLKVSDNADLGAMIQQEISTRQNDVAALAYMDERLQAVYDKAAEATLDNAAALEKVNSRTNAFYKKSVDALATETTARVQAIETLSTTVNGNTTSVQTLASSVDGIKGTYTVKIDSGGRMVGYSLISNAAQNDSPPDSAFIVKADKFAVGYPGQVGVYPFQIGVVNGQSVVGVNGQLLVDGSVSARSIKTNELIVGDNITMGPNATIGWSKVTGAPNTTKIDINGIYTGTLTAGQVDILNTIQSTNFVAGYSGWKIDKVGRIECRDLTARGDIEASSLKANTAMIDTIHLKDASVDTLRIKGQSVSFGLGFYQATEVGAGVIASLTMPAPASQSEAGPVYLTASATVRCNSQGGAPNLILKRNGTEVARSTWYMAYGYVGDITSLSITFIDSSERTNNTVYELVGSTYAWSNRALVAQELKR